MEGSSVERSSVPFDIAPDIVAPSEPGDLVNGGEVGIVHVVKQRLQNAVVSAIHEVLQDRIQTWTVAICFSVRGKTVPLPCVFRAHAIELCSEDRVWRPKPIFEYGDRVAVIAGLLERRHPQDLELRLPVSDDIHVRVSPPAAFRHTHTRTQSHTHTHPQSVSAAE